MEKYEVVPRGEKWDNSIAIQFNKMLKNLAVNPLEKTLENLVAIFRQYDLTDISQIATFQSKVAFLFENLVELWLKNGKKTIDFKKEVDMFFNLKNDLPDFFEYVRPEQIGKRQPSIIESINETLERFEMMEKLEPIFEKTCKGIIVGGSLAYGAFYNIRSEKEGNEGSDVDLILVLDSNSDEKDWDSFLQASYFTDSDKKLFMVRKNIFLKSLVPKNEASVLSQKFRLKDKNYDVSMHFFTDNALDSILLNDIEREVDNVNKVSMLMDYKAVPFPHNICRQNNFEGESYEYIVSKQKVTDCGVITELPKFAIINHKFYPGVYQNLILPSFFIFSDRDGEITNKTATFKNAVVKYIQDKYGKENVSDAISKSHPRNKIFPKKA